MASNQEKCKVYMMTGFLNFELLFIGPLQSKKTFLMSTPKHPGVQIFRFTQLKLTIDPPGIKLPQQLYMVYSFTFYPALYVVIWCSTPRQVSHTFINSENFCQFPGVVVVLLIAYCCCCELHINNSGSCACCCCCVIHNNNNNMQSKAQQHLDLLHIVY